MTEAVSFMDDDGNVKIVTPSDPLPTTATIEGGGDATAANQTSQITQETAINTVLGTKADAKNAATDTTAVSAISLLKQISEYLKGAIADGAADSGTSSKIGSIAKAGLAGETLESAGDRMPAKSGLDGAIFVRNVPLEDIVSGVAAITDGSSTSVIASAGAGVKNYISSVIISNTSATAVTVDLRDGAAGAVKATFPVPANTSGVVCNLPTPIPFSAATAVCADPSAAASTVTVTLVGFKSKI